MFVSSSSDRHSQALPLVLITLVTVAVCVLAASHLIGAKTVSSTMTATTVPAAVIPPTAMPTTPPQPTATAQGASVATAQPGAFAPAGSSPAASDDASPVAVSLEDALPQLLATMSSDTGVYGVMVIDPQGNTVFAQNPDIPFESASLYKLPLMAQIESMIEAGTVTLDEQVTLDQSFYPDWQDEDPYYTNDTIGTTVTVQNLLFATGAYSSNVGAFALASLTTWDDVQAEADALGMNSTYMNVYPSSLADWPPTLTYPDDSSAALQIAAQFLDSEAASGPVMITTPRDIATFFQELMAGQVVDQTASQALIGILSQQTVDDRFPVLLPDGTTVIHKTGNLDGVIHDAGVIETASGPVIVAALSENVGDGDAAYDMMQQLALDAFNAYSYPATASGH